MPDQRDIEEKGGTMRLGLYPAKLQPGTEGRPRPTASELIYERHRHRFEVNNRYREALEEAGMLLAGQSPDGRLVEIVELRDHPWFVASQFHPEFKSRPEQPHPLFAGFVAAAIERPRGATIQGQPRPHGRRDRGAEALARRGVRPIPRRAVDSTTAVQAARVATDRAAVPRAARP